MSLFNLILKHLRTKEVFLPTYILFSGWFYLRGKKILGDHRARIRGLKNIQTQERLTVGTQGESEPPWDAAWLDIAGEMIVEKSSHIGRGCHFKVSKGAKLILKGCHFTGGSTIIARCHVEIGHDCVIAWGTQFMDWDSHRIEYPGKRTDKPTHVILEDHVWIGGGACILRGVTIGRGSVVAAGSVVTKSCPPNVLLAGNPAKVIRENISWGNFHE